MKKTLNVIKNPRLDRIFTEAYQNTMKQVAVREQHKHDADFYDTFSQLFEKELYNRDLTAEERQDFMATFHQEVETLHKRTEERQKRRKRVMMIGGPSLLAAVVLCFSLYVAVARPFMPVSKITEQLDYYQVKVEEGYGSYSQKFYRLIDRRGSKLPAGTEAEYRSSMYETLDNQFDTTIEKLEAGEVRYYDDAKKWASRFPEAEERSDRKEQAENSFKKGLGTAVGNTIDDVKESARNFFQKAGDFIKDMVKRED